jgi:hypothetical protein
MCNRLVLSCWSQALSRIRTLAEGFLLIGVVMTEKKLVEKTIYSDVIDCLEGSLEDAIAFIKAIPEDHKDFQDFRFEIHYGYESTDLELIGKKLETDKEFKNRLYI